ncbi:hypothetical protein PVT01_000010400 [Plasmodium vivax]|uniref:VIR protein n=1 Tax=Plasmodium vivax TaxID=5855 RepID=A0A1G4E8W4_PLAVI|nr:hypothetical protein PVT01_000010400 [Plasmodium vivax]
MSEIDDKDQIPHKFYSRLDEAEDVSKFYNLHSKPAILPYANNIKTQQILAQLARNIELIISEYSGNTNKRCRDINHWMNEKIKVAENNIHGDDLETSCLIVFNDVKWNKRDNKDIVCKREKEPYKTEPFEIMKKLDDYCEIRDNVRCDIFKNYDECLRYNRYIKQKKQEFTSKMEDICSKTDCSRNVYSIGDNCTLNKMDDTFREINCDALYEKAQIQEPLPVIKERSPLEIGFFIIVSFILFYLFILFLEKVT